MEYSLSSYLEKESCYISLFRVLLSLASLNGLFSYFLMKGLEGDADTNNDKKITYGELHSYVRSNVTRQAVRLGREQTPQLQGDENRVLVEFN